MNFNLNEVSNKLNFGKNAQTLPTTQSNTPNGILSSWFNNSNDQTVTAEESQGLMNSGTNMFSSISSQTRNMISGARDRVNELTLTREKIMIAGVSILTGIVFFFLAFTFLPVMVISPHKFAMLFTVGSLCFLFAFSTMRGHKEFLKHLISKERIWFSLTYISTLVLTLYSSLIIKSYILAILFSVLQIIALFYFTLSYIPGGTRALNFIGGGIKNSIKKLFNKGSSEEESGILNIV